MLSQSQYELWALLESLEGPSSLLDFIAQWSPGFERPEHLHALVDALWRASRGERVRALISVPPRHGKTETLLNFIPWFLLQHPERTVAYVTYQASVAESKSKRARDLVNRLGLPLRTDSQSSKEWRTTENGGVLATSIGGPLTSHGVNILLIDDPTKNREEAESPLLRERNYQWFESTAASRLEPKGSIFVCHTRWHDDDLIGRLNREQKGRWEVINLPALNEQNLPLWPSRWPLAELIEKKIDVGPYEWASLYQGEPRPRGGRMFVEPARFELEKLDLDGCRIILACDPAATASTSADYSAVIVLAAKGHGRNQRVYILDVQREQIEIPVLVKRLLRLQKDWGSPVYIESVGGFKAVAQTMRAMDPRLRIVETTPQGDKFTRALPVAAAWNAERVLVPTDAFWVNAFLDEVLRFTGVKDAHDDQVDALSGGFAAIDRRLETVTGGAQETVMGGLG